jgi:hypothetical protein
LCTAVCDGRDTDVIGAPAVGTNEANRESTTIAPAAVSRPQLPVARYFRGDRRSVTDRFVLRA